MARRGATVAQIRSVTGHSLASAAIILEKYLPIDNEMAAEAQRLRGIV
jgi:hypothetical protein